ncbi:MAG: glycosyltransferase family 39 protein [Planctomycetota bacterium]
MRSRLPLLAVLLAALVLRLVGIGHGFPETEYVPDTHEVRAALGMAKDKDPFPPVGRYSTYPNLLPYVLLPCYAGQYALGRVTGEWGGADEYGMRLKLEPARAHRVARIVTALFGAALAIVVWLVLRDSGARDVAAIGAWLAATCLLDVHFSVQERPWAPLATFGMLACWFGARHAVSGRRRDVVLCGLACGAAAATHQAGIPMLGICGIAWAASTTPWRPFGERFVQGVLGVASFAAVAVVVGYNAYLVHGAPAASPDATGDLAVGGQAIVFAVRWASVEHLVGAMLGYDPVICVLALVGLVAALRSRGARVPTLFGLAWLAFFTTNQNDHVRYVLPGVVLLIVPAAVGARTLLARGAAGRAALGLLLLFPLVQSARLALVLTREDTRAVATRELLAHPPDGVVAVDRYGPELPPNLASLDRASSYRELYAREELEAEAIRAGVIEDGPVEWFRIGEVLAFDERHRGSQGAPGRFAGAASADEVLDALGADLVLLVDRDTSDDLPPLLVDPAPSLPFERGARAGRPAPKLPPIALAGEPLLVVGEDRAEQRLPTELDFALTTIWRVRRPGPRLELWKRE